MKPWIEEDDFELVYELMTSRQREDAMVDCVACNCQGIDEHCLGHHFLARGTEYEKCQEGCCDDPPCEHCFPEIIEVVGD